MELQQWKIIRNIDGEKDIIGHVLTTLGADKNIAISKACHKYNGGSGIIIGWKFEAKKDGIVNR